MTSITSTPPEIWQYILRHVIHVPVFLDPNGVAASPTSSMDDNHIYGKTSPRNDERPYWESERFRNACRRVCRLWNTYLGESIAHRFVRFTDVTQGFIPESTLNDAIRVSLHLDRYGRVRLQGPGKPLNPPIHWYNIERIMREKLSQVTNGKMRILIAPSIVFGEDYIVDIATKFPNLVTFVSFMIGLGLGNSIQLLPRLRHVYTKRYKCLGHNSVLNCSHLETLSFQPEFVQSEDFVTMGWHLPALKTLRIITDETQADEQAWNKTTTSLLKALDHNIRSLYISPEYLPVTFDDMIQACPKLEHLVVHPTKPGAVNVPILHPLKTIVLPWFSPWSVRPTKPDLTWPGWPTVRTVVFSVPWDESNWKDELIRGSYLWKGSPVRIEDSNGVELDEWAENKTKEYADSVGIGSLPDERVSIQGITHSIAMLRR